MRNFDFHGISRYGEGRFTVLCRCLRQTVCEKHVSVNWTQGWLLNLSFEGLHNFHIIFAHFFHNSSRLTWKPPIGNILDDSCWETVTLVTVTDDLSCVVTVVTPPNSFLSQGQSTQREKIKIRFNVKRKSNTKYSIWTLKWQKCKFTRDKIFAKDKNIPKSDNNFFTGTGKNSPGKLKRNKGWHKQRRLLTS